MYQNLLSAARLAYDQEQFNEAIILAQTAVELFTEKTLRHLYRARDVEYLKEPFEHLLINYNIGNAKVSRLYIALAEDDIHQAPFWQAFVTHTELRNELVHEGRTATAEQAQASLKAVDALLAHVSDAVGSVA